MSGPLLFLTIPGDPPRALQPRIASKPFARMYATKPSKLWMSHIELMAREAWHGRGPLIGPIELELTLVWSLPKTRRVGSKPTREPKSGISQWQVSKPDRDNSEKPVQDALTHARVWQDDCQVCEGPVRKLFTVASEGFAEIILRRPVVPERFREEGFADVW
ncbi:MAG: RusA family crossover junction endodeoxyribonuclease [Planctomycetota bacterium]